MKFNCDVFKDWRKARRKKKEEWRAHYAWFPVKIQHGDCRWLEMLERRQRYSYYSHYPYWEYREIQPIGWSQNRAVNG